MKKALFLVLTILVLSTLSGFAEKVLVYISGPEGMVKQIEQTFEKQYGDCIDVFHTGSGPLKQKVFTEMMVGDIQADIIWGAEPLMYYQLKDNDVLETYFPKGYEHLKDAYRYGDGYFTPTNARYGTIIYNASKLSEEEIPLTWTDLVSDQWKGRIAMADGSQSSMAYALAGALYFLENGQEILKSIGENDVLLTKMNIDATSKVQSGEKDICITPSDGAIRIIKSMEKKGLTSNLRIIYPTDGAFSIQRPIAIVKKERNEVELEVIHNFIDFSISEESQEISQRFGFVSVRDDDGSAENIKELHPDWENILDNQEEILYFYEEHVLD